MLKLKRYGNKVYVNNAGQKALDIIDEALAVKIEGGHYSEKFKDGDWDGYARFFHKNYNYFQFGLIDRVKDVLDRANIPYTVHGFEDRSTKWVKFSTNFRSSERDYQRNSMLAFLKRGYGVIKVPTRGGKTYIAGELIRLLVDKEQAISLFIVDNADLFEQAPHDISLITGIPVDRIGKIQGNVFNPKGVTVAMIQTIQSKLFPNKSKAKTRERRVELDARKKQEKVKMQEYLARVKFLIIDEVQEFGDSTRRFYSINTIKNAIWNLSLSATPHKSTSAVGRMNVEALGGNITYDISEKSLVKRGVLAKSKVLLIGFNHVDMPNYEDLPYKEIVDRLIFTNARRNLDIIRVARFCKKLGLKTIIITPSVVQGKCLAEISKWNFISGDDSVEDRKDVKVNFLSSNGGALIVTDIWKKGITLPSVEVIINAGGGLERSLILQRRGRVLGATETKKKALCIDFLDFTEYYLNEHSLERVKAYETMISSKKIDFINRDLIKKELSDYLKKWFNK